MPHPSPPPPGGRCETGLAGAQAPARAVSGEQSVWGERRGGVAAACAVLWGRRGRWAPLLCLLTSPLCFPLARSVPPPIPQLRARGPASRGDRYMLVTFEEPPYAIKAGWKENHATFMNELKNLQAEGLRTLGQSLRTAFDLLNLNRLVTGIDNYGKYKVGW
uniref:VWFA domain-containing protein n=1 Tax=Theropithecus gelada TaxID=9565 RepID=A0A8D2EXB3_THEGE